MNSFKKYITNKIFQPLLSFLKQGVSPEKLSLTLALGISFGIIPIFGVNSIILAALAFLFHLNIAAIQIVNYAVYLLQIILFVPFLKLGQVFFLSSKIKLNFDRIFEQITTNFAESIIDIWQIVLAGLTVWLIFSIPLSIAIYYISKPLFYKQLTKSTTN